MIVRVAFGSDNHLDVNQVSVEETLHQQAKWLNEHHVQAKFSIIYHIQY